MPPKCGAFRFQPRGSDETTVCRFRHLLEEHDLGQQLFDEVQRHLAANGLKVVTGTIIDSMAQMLEKSVRNGLAAGGSRIRTIGSSPKSDNRIGLNKIQSWSK
jgi:IS5 family transposase